MNNLNDSMNPMYALSETTLRNDTNEIITINDFIKKFDFSKITSPRFSARDLMNVQLNRDGTPKRPMNSFFCFKRIFYLEVVEQELLDLVKDGVFITKAAGVVWKSRMNSLDKKVYQKFSEEVKYLQSNFHKNKNYDKKKPVGSIFHNVNFDNFCATKLHKGKMSKKNRMTKQMKQKNFKSYDQDQKFQLGQSERNYQQTKQGNHTKSQQMIPKDMMDDQRIQLEQFYQIQPSTNRKQEKIHVLKSQQIIQEPIYQPEQTYPFATTMSNHLNFDVDAYYTTGYLPLDTIDTMMISNFDQDFQCMSSDPSGFC